MQYIKIKEEKKDLWHGQKCITKIISKMNKIKALILAS
jgi:hypothetical protein